MKEPSIYCSHHSRETPRAELTDCPVCKELRRALVAFEESQPPMARLGWQTVIEQLPQARAPEPAEFDEGQAYRDAIQKKNGSHQ